MDSLGVLVIAGILFLVTMALAVGPLLLCRLFAGSSEACLPRKRRHPFATGNVAACGSMAAVAGALFAMWFVTGETRQTVILGEDQPATAVGATEIAATPIGSERSLFDGNQSSSDPAPTVHVVSHRLSWAAILLPLLLATTLLGVVSDRLRGGLFRVLPVVFAGGLLIVLFVRSSTHHEYHRAVVAHSVQLAHGRCA